MSTSDLAEGVIQFMAAPAGQAFAPPVGEVPQVFFEAARSLMAEGETTDELSPGAPQIPGNSSELNQQSLAAAEAPILDFLRESFRVPESAMHGQIPAPTSIPTSIAEPPLPPVLPVNFHDIGGSAAFIQDLFPRGAEQVPDTPHSQEFCFLSEPARQLTLQPVAAPFEVESIRRDFPILHQKVHGKPLVWLDNAATTHKPQAVIDAVSNFYAHDNSNIHRGAHALAARSTDAYEQARQRVQRFLGAASTNEIVFTRGTTEAINLVAQSYGGANVGEGDEIVLTTLEHHANIVPWQMLAKRKCAKLRVVPITDEGDVVLEDFERLIGPNTKLVAVAHVSNVLGTILPVTEIVNIAHRHGTPVCVDGAQAVAHAPVDVQQLGADFYVFSGHKVFGPTGVGVLYGREELLRKMPPWQGGGNMIQDVTFEETTYSEPPAKFEAGTSMLAEAVGLGVALEYITKIGRERIEAYERDLTTYGIKLLGAIPGLRLIGTSSRKVGVFSFVMDGVPTEEVGHRLDLEGIAVRAGHHCAQPTLARYGLKTSVRPSIAIYNTRAELDQLAGAVERIRREYGRR